MTDQQTHPSPTTILIFGASGDLTQRKLLPALYSLFRKGRLPAGAQIIGNSRTPYTHEEFRAHALEGVKKYAGHAYDAAVWQAFAQHVWYIAGDSTTTEDYTQLHAALQEIEGGPANRLYYLAVAPTLFAPIAEQLGASGMAAEDGGWRRIVIEKPYGRDLESARELDQMLHGVFQESQIYRIDHYLGKETAQNIFFFRFANTIFEPVWNNRYIDSVQITVLEQVGVERRGAYYDKAGVLRDMFQNHLLQLLTLVAMEPPASYDADAVRNEKVRVLRDIPPINLADTFRAQYRGYREERGVDPNSQTATYGALKLHIDNERWRGVPFYLRSGKALVAKSSEIIIQFLCPPFTIFECADFTPNVLSLCIQPDEGIHLKFQAKVPDTRQETRTVDMGFHYRNQFEYDELPDAYERLLLDALHGDASLFPRNDMIEQSWMLMDPIIRGWEVPGAPPLAMYAPGGCGPLEADDFIARDGRSWRMGCGWSCLLRGIPHED